MIVVYLGGEGRNELGSRAREAPHQDDSEPGVVATLLRCVQPEGWHVVGACQWSRIVKLRARGPTPNEEKNVLGLAHEANREGARILAFVRDGDGNKERSNEIEAAILKCKKVFPNVEVIGGTAVPVLEAWILAAKGEHGTDKLGKTAAQNKLAKSGVSPKNTQAMVASVRELVPDKLPQDARSLITWLETAKGTLPRRVAEEEDDKA